MGHQEERASTLPPLGHLLHLLHYFCVYELEGIYFGTLWRLYEASNKEEGLYKGEKSKTIQESFKDKKVASFPPFSFVHKWD